MLNEVNALIDQNSRLVKEVDELRYRLRKQEGTAEDLQSPNRDQHGNPLKYSETDLQQKLAQDRESVQSQLQEFQTIKKKLKKEEDNRKAFVELAKKKEDDCKTLQRLFDNLNSEL